MHSRSLRDVNIADTNRVGDGGRGPSLASKPCDPFVSVPSVPPVQNPVNRFRTTLDEGETVVSVDTASCSVEEPEPHTPSRNCRVDRSTQFYQSFRARV